jgi:hypothetical protein
MGIGALGNEGCSQRIGSAQEASSLRAVARGWHASLRSACHPTTTLLQPPGRGTEGMAFRRRSITRRGQAGAAPISSSHEAARGFA